jgi:hypothetical protein
MGGKKWGMLKSTEAEFLVPTIFRRIPCFRYRRPSLSWGDMRPRQIGFQQVADTDRGGPACRSSQIRANPWRCTALEIRSSDMRDANLAECRIF